MKKLSLDEIKDFRVGELLVCHLPHAKEDKQFLVVFLC